jgi:hypothetical protein
MKRGPKTADQVLAELEADPEFRARRDAREAAFEKRRVDLARAEAPLVADLRAAGVAVNSVYDLVNTRESYPAALPILIRHLDVDYPPPIVEGIARALAVPAAHVAWRKLVDRFKSSRDVGPQQGFAVAVAGTANDERLDELIELVLDPRYGTSRVLLVSALERSKLQKARAVLEALQSDPQIGQGAKAVLKKLNRRKRQPSHL